MTPFDPKHPHGHMRRDGYTKAEILRTLEDGRHAVLLTASNGTQWVAMYRPDGTPSCHPYVEHFLVNAPAPKRTWEVVAWENTYKQVVFVTEKQRLPGMWKVVGRYTLPEGEGMEEKDG